LAAGCGSSGGSDTTGGGAATATSPVEGSDLQRLPQVREATGQSLRSSSADTRAFLTQVFDNAQGMWRREFQDAGLNYRPARLTIFTDRVGTACGAQSANVGPFYCPASSGVYLDVRFFDALARKVRVPLVDFAQAYVVAHEVGHHVQTLLGITQRKAIADRRDPRGENARSVRFELQADCFAGLWARSVYERGAVSDADIRDALNAAAVVGDDFLAKAGGGIRPPEEWTHGSSAQRQRWFKTGFTEGEPAACDTFSG
jgi:predicted metalloprotease